MSHVLLLERLMRTIGLLVFAVVILAIGSPAARSQNPVTVRSFDPRDLRLEGSARRHDFDGLVRELRENSDDQGYYSEFRSGGGSPNSRFHLMLRDCRIAKLRSYLHAKPAAEQAVAAEQLFDQCLEAFETYEATLKKRDPFQDSQVVVIGGNAPHDAVLAMLLLCSEVCEPISVMHKVDSVKAVVARSRTEDVGSFGTYSKPDAAYLRNLYLYFLELRFPESVTDAEVRTAVSFAGPDRRKEVAIVYWDLKSNSIAESPARHATCRLFPEFYGMGHEKSDALQEQRLRVVVDRYVAKANSPAK